ncbi:hypothetical protein TCON_0424 [Astathelohania contejeani]|uniref:Uncharacterized protein n=1 Tax=Astathelohania contejeani TaxID=164912 RepID=A0ABQ7I1X6_9MICR|nr:hypothetical protein TCON_0424 [Thelohania contejeani]
MIFELSSGNNGFLYYKEKSELSVTKYKFIINEVEEVQNIYIANATIKNLPVVKLNIKFEEQIGFHCKCGKQIKYESLNRLPLDGWEELINCWSCHDSEFKSMLDLKIKPRKMGILYSNFYLLINGEDLPKCCFNVQGIQQIFYNQLNVLDPEKLLFFYFEELFFNSSNFLFIVNSVKYEIKYFHDAVVLSIEEDSINVNKALKVGYKITNKVVKNPKHINEYYLKELIRILNDNSLKLKILDFEISFLKYEIN